MSKIRETPEPPYIYKSFYGAGYLKAAQYMAELMCKRKAGYEQRTLPSFFWRSLPDWAKYYQAQVRHASSLLLAYDADAILRVLGRLPKAYSLKSQFLLTKIEEEFSKKEYRMNQEEVAPVEEVKTWGSGPSMPKKLQNLLDEEL